MGRDCEQLFADFEATSIKPNLPRRLKRRMVEKVNVEEGVGMRMNTMALERTRKMRTSAGTYEHWPEEKVDH